MKTAAAFFFDQLDNDITFDTCKQDCDIFGNLVNNERTCIDCGHRGVLDSKN